MDQTSHPRLAGPPLALQIVGLLVGSLIVAQMVTLFLTMMLPPEPPPQYSLETIARTLTGEAFVSGAGRPLQRLVQENSPAPSGPGWLTSEHSRHDLAVLLKRDDVDVQLFFYTPLPFAGVARAPQKTAQLTFAAPAPQQMARDEPHHLAPGFIDANFQVAAAGTAGGFPGGGFPGGFPGGGFPGAAVPGAGFPNAAAPVRIVPVPLPVAPVMSAPAAGVHEVISPATPQIVPARPADGATMPPVTGPNVTGAVMLRPGVFSVAPGSTLPAAGLSNGVASRLVAPAIAVSGSVIPSQIPIPLPEAPRKLRPAPEERQISAPNHVMDASPVVQPAPAPLAPAPDVASAPVQEAPAERPKPLAAAPQAVTPVTAPLHQRSLFGLEPAPFVEGDFVAAMRLASGQWVVVQPAPEPFPNSWQRRLLLWFVLSFSLVAPVGWLFARRLVRPIAGFAYAAEQLGRDPTASVLALEGPAEVGRAASAFNRMQSRLKSFVDDRTAMVGAISHDLRTPLTRLRFRIEDVPDDLREGMLAEVEEMEQMISSVLAFIRDASEPGAREKIDLRSIVEDVVEDAVFIGKPVTLEKSEQAPVEVDPLGMRRLLGNLVENAVKYGDTASIRLFKDHQDAVAEVTDNGPGLPDEELERVFQPFYRAPQARASNKHGTGLGLAVCRSIARAHGGDVHLIRRDHGLVAQLRLPLAYGATTS
ncbi:MAG TPA: ATP-binding protein [Rhizomicrobium sp.]|nr:ATP-binding protein [Rhizomicrobium sp.]